MINDKGHILREFACHTAVILAQPRVSRLRADAGYVDSWGFAGLRGRSAEIDTEHSGEFFQGPPKSLQICPTDIPKMTQRVQKRVLSGNEIWAPKHAQSLYSERIHKEPYREM